MTLTTPTIVIAILGVIAAYLTQMINTGSILGLKTVPQAWLPYLTVLGTFLATVITQLRAASTIDGAVVFQAIIAGLLMLAAPATGTALHTHFKVAATVLLLIGALGGGAAALTACGVGQIFGPGSNLPADAQADANCVADQLVSGDLNPVSIGVACKAQVTATFLDLITWVTDKLFGAGKISIDQVDTVTGNVTVAKGALK